MISNLTSSIVCCTAPL